MPSDVVCLHKAHAEEDLQPGSDSGSFQISQSPRAKTTHPDRADITHQAPSLITVKPKEAREVTASGATLKFQAHTTALMFQNWETFLMSMLPLMPIIQKGEEEVAYIEDSAPHGTPLASHLDNTPDERAAPLTDQPEEAEESVPVEEPPIQSTQASTTVPTAIQMPGLEVYFHRRGTSPTRQEATEQEQTQPVPSPNLLTPIN